VGIEPIDENGKAGRAPPSRWRTKPRVLLPSKLTAYAILFTSSDFVQYHPVLSSKKLSFLTCSLDKLPPSKTEKSVIAAFVPRFLNISNLSLPKHCSCVKKVKLLINYLHFFLKYVP